jgi:hypothetical protein
MLDFLVVIGLMVISVLALIGAFVTTVTMLTVSSYYRQRGRQRLAMEHAMSCRSE